MRRCRRFFLMRTMRIVARNLFELMTSIRMKVMTAVMMTIVMMIVVMMMIARRTARWSRSVCSVVKPLLHHFPYLAPITPASQQMYKDTQNLNTLGKGANKFGPCLLTNLKQTQSAVPTYFIYNDCIYSFSGLIYYSIKYKVSTIKMSTKVLLTNYSQLNNFLSCSRNMNQLHILHSQEAFFQESTIILSAPDPAMSELDFVFTGLFRSLVPNRSHKGCPR